MKTLSKIRIWKSHITRCLLVLFLLFNVKCIDAQSDPRPSKKKSIKLAILLDTSNSMDGLIAQAKSQLWKIVNELAKAECDNVKPDLKIALYEYGNDNLPASEGYIRMVTPLTTDLDQISDDLFSLTTRGGQEFCGHVIQSSLRELNWSKTSDDYQVMFIAGNEPFTQGSVNFREACAEAKRKGVIINTIFCGNFDEGINTSWKTGADLTGGDYFSIDQNRKTVYIATPYDDKIVILNQQLNNTYIYYGSQGMQKKEMQVRQDANAASYGQSNVVNRAVSKSTHAYKNKSWDLVDAAEEVDFEIQEVEVESLPAEMQKMTEKERVEYIEKKKDERDRIKKEINELNIKRSQYLAEKQKENSEDNTLDNAMLKSIKTQAKSKEFVFK